MRINPLHSVRVLCDWMQVVGEYPPTERGTGRSTAQALRYIASAIENPYEVIQVRDHHGSTQSDEHLCQVIHSMVCGLGLKHFYISGKQRTMSFGKP